jgi:hypothetical protein
MESSQPEPINPYAVTVPYDMVAPANLPRPPRVVRYSGAVEASHLRKYYHEPMQFGCAMVVLVSTMIVWMGLFGVIFGIVAVGAIAFMGFLLGLWMGRRYLSKSRVVLCIEKRPWLVGKTRGVISGSRWTVWNDDVLIQTNDHTYFDEAFKGSVLYPRQPYPIAFAPSECFYEQEWHEIYEDYRRDRFMPLVVEAPPADACVCRIATHRLPVLEDRSMAMRGRLSQNSFWMAVVFGMGLFLFWRIHEWIGVWGTIGLLVGAWIGFEALRFGWAWNRLHRQFPANGAGYRVQQLATDSRLQASEQWFTRDTILSTDMSHWIRIPASYLDRVQITAIAIEFYVGGMRLAFFREGFESASAWESACQVAKSMDPSQRRA